MSFTEVFGGANIFPAQVSLLKLTLTADVTLSWPVEQAVAGEDVMAWIIQVTPNAGLAITFPNATLAAEGQAILVNNVGANTVTLKDNAGNVIGTVASGVVKQLYLSDNTTAAGTWKIFTFGTGASSADAAALAGAGLKAITTTLNQKHTPRSSAASPLAIVDADRAAIVQWTGGVGAGTLPDPATLGTDWFTMVRNNGTGTWTITPAAGTIDGQATLDLSPFASALIYTDGVDYFTIGLSSTTPTNFDYTTINVAGTGTDVLSGTELNRISYKFTGILTGARTIEIPTTVQQYWVNNATTGAFSLTVKTNAGLGVVVPQGYSMLLYCDGTDVIAAEGSPTTGAIPVALAGTGITSYTQGDLIYASATTTLSKLPKDATATRYLANTGGSNNPNWDQINLANGVTGRLPYANLTQGSALSVLGVAGNSVADVASITGAANQVLRIDAAGTGLAFGAINLAAAAAVTGVLDETNGGTGQSTYAQGDMLYASAADTLAKLAKDAVGLKFLTNTGSSNNPAWLTARFGVTAAANSDITFGLTDAWNWVPHTGAATQNWGIPANATTAFPVGSMIGCDNRAGADTISIVPAGGVTLDGHGTTGTFLLPKGYKAILVKVDTNTWIVMSDAPIASGQGVLYASFCTGSAGAAVTIKNNTAAAGWTVAQAAAGLFTVTHNLGLSAATDLSVVANVRLSAGGTDDRFCNITNETVNAFDVSVVDAGAGAVDDDFYFHATRLV